MIAPEMLTMIAGLTLCGLAATAYALAATWKFRRANLALVAQLTAMSGELERLDAATSDAVRRAAEVERQCRLVGERLLLTESHTANRSFEEAIDSARRGAAPGKLAVRFGLSRGEADLVARLHGRAEVLEQGAGRPDIHLVR
jgi:hypothetical protein